MILSNITDTPTKSAVSFWYINWWRKDERSDDNNQWIDFLESDLDDIEQMLVDNHIDEDAISDILDKLIQFKEGLARRVIGARGREVFSSLIAKYLHSNIWTKKLPHFIATHPQYCR